MRSIRPKHLDDELKANALAGIPTMIWGDTGICKSDKVYQLAKSMNAKLFELRANLFDPVDVRGGLKVVEQVDGTYRTKYGVPEDYPASDYEGTCIIFIDELTAAPQATQNSFLQILTTGKIGQYQAPKNTIFIAAGNRLKDRAAVKEMPAPVKTRFSHFLVEADVDDWCEWAYDNNIDPSIISFIRFRPNLLHDINHHENANPCPRTWAWLSKKLPFMKDEFYGCASLVGDGAAGEYLSYKAIYKDIPDPQDIFDKPSTTKVPDSPSMLYAVAGSIAINVTPENFEKGMKYIKRMPAEFQVVTIRDTIARNKDLARHQSFTDWTAANASVFM